MAYKLPYSFEKDLCKLPDSNIWRARTSSTDDAKLPGHEFDAQLAERIAKGDSEALAMMLDRHLSAVYGYIARRLGPGHVEEAAEISISTFTAALRHLRPYERDTATIPMQLWLIRQASKQIAHRQPKIGAPGPHSTESEQLTSLRTAMRSLPPGREAVLSLALFEGMPASEIAAASGMSVGRAMRLLRSTLRQVGRRLQDNDESEEEPVSG